MNVDVGCQVGRLRWCNTPRDSVKLTRAVEDALTGVLWQDDSQVVFHCLTKVWGPCYRVGVKVLDLTSESLVVPELP